MPEQLENGTEQQPNRNEEDEIHLLDLLIVLVRNKKMVIGLPLVTGSLAFVASLLVTPIYTSTTKILPPQQQSSGAAAMLGQLGGLAGAAGGLAGIKSPNDLYIGMLESRTVADNLIKRFNLQDRYESKSIDDARATLAEATQVSNSKKDGLISVTFKDKEAQFAADLANAYVDELVVLTQTMAVSEASKRRLFFEKQLVEAKEQLANSEVALRATQEKTGMIQPEGQLQAIISSVAQIKGAIAAKEVQLNAMRTFATGQNPELLRGQEELRGLQQQLTKLEKNQLAKSGDFMVPTGKIPQAGLEYIRSLRDVRYNEARFEILAKQYELAKVDEAKDSMLVQVLDKAVPAERKPKSKRALMTVVGFIGGGVLALLFAFMREAYLRARQNPDNQNRWSEFELAWKNHRDSRPLRMQPESRLPLSRPE